MKKHPFRLLKRLFLVVLISIILAFVGLSLASRFIAHDIQERLVDELDVGSTIDVDGISTYYRESGIGNPKTIVLIHGFLGSSFDYLELIALLNDDFHLIAIDLIGFGLSDKPLDFDYSKQNQAERVEAVVTALGVTTFTLVGHSMGGEVALHFVLLFPERVSELILLDAAGLSAGSPGPLPLFFYDLFVKNYFLQRWGFSGAYADPLVGSKDRFDRMFFFNDQIPSAILRDFSVDDDSGSLANRLDEVTLPTLIVWGTADRFIPVDNSQLFSESISYSEILLVEGAGHLPFQENPLVVADAIRDFLLSS